MRKTFLKKFLHALICFAPILALFYIICNHFGLRFYSNLEIFTSEAVPAETLGDRGGSHLPDLGINLPQETWFIVLVSLVAVISLGLIVFLVVLKIKMSKKPQEQNESENKQENAKTSLKEIVARNMENEKQEYKQIDNPKHE